MQPPITVVIPNYNGAHLLRKNIPSVKAALNVYCPKSTIIVVDDGSKDESLQVLKNEFPEIQIVVHAQNKGFAEAIHSGVKAAETELLFLLNSDVEVALNIFEPLVEYFDSPNTFAVNPLILDESGQVKRHSWNLRRIQGGHLKLLDWDLNEALNRRSEDDWLPTVYAHGGSFMVRKSMFLALHGFHPIYKPFYSEDYDLGIRAWRMGWGSYFEPSVSIVHQSVGSIRANTKMKLVKCTRRRNRYLLEWIHFPLWQLLFKGLPFNLLQLLGEVLTMDFVNLKGFYLALLKLPEVILVRRKLSEDKAVSLTEVLKEIH